MSVQPYRRAPAIAFANAKGGVGKSTLAFLTVLYLAARGYRVRFLDLDPLRAGEQFVARFVEGSHILVGRPDSAQSEYRDENDYHWSDPTSGTDPADPDLLIIDTPAGVEPGDLFFLGPQDLLLIPASLSDVDVAVTGDFCARLYREEEGAARGMSAIEVRRELRRYLPHVMLVPNMIDDDAGLYRLRNAAPSVPALPPVCFSNDIRRMMQSSPGESTIVAALRQNGQFFERVDTWTMAAVRRYRASVDEVAADTD